MEQVATEQEQQENVQEDSKIIVLWKILKSFAGLAYLIPKELIKKVFINPLFQITAIITGDENVNKSIGILFSILLCIASIFSYQLYYHSSPPPPTNQHQIPSLPLTIPIKIPNTSSFHLFPTTHIPTINNWPDLMEQIKQIWSRLEGDGNHLQQQVSRLQSEFNHHLQVHDLDQEKVWSELQNKQTQLNLLQQFINRKLDTSTTTKEQQQQQQVPPASSADEKNSLVPAALPPVDNPNDLDTEQIKSLIQSAIYKYHQDILDEADYALKTRHASILYSLTSATYYHAPAWQQSIFRFVGLVTESNSPELAISSQIDVGRCWSMDGNQGTLGIVLSEPIFIDGISIEYPSPNLLHHRMEHAPRSIELLGISNYPKRPSQLVSLGIVEYDIFHNDSTVQTFRIYHEEKSLFKAVQVRVHSNWGSSEHTDIYRVRIHGQPAAVKDL
ncbi:UNC-like C-terminal-domain-containing protein [Pilaira anomala]|nr:UNC-like C-terminal-domain-containing protein [Pilaira anomala]